MRKQILAAGAAFACVAALVSAVVFSAAPASGYTAADFRPGNIMSDAVFYNSASMSASDIQTFLNSKVPKCQPGYTCLPSYSAQTAVTVAQSGLCNAYPVAATQSAATIVATVSQVCGINPQVLLVLMQKEQGLVTATAPSAYAYNYATGNNCPDSTGCNAGSSGFFQQVYGAARQFKLYRLNPTNYNYVAGQNNYIAYNPSPSCGGSWVYIENQATAGLYDYTPYQPNAAALANLHGTGDSCSAYGNRNFWVFYNDWFGPIPGPPVAPSAPALGPAVVATGNITAAYRTSAGNLWGANQPSPGSPFGPSAVVGATAPGGVVGTPVALKAYNSTIVVYARNGYGQMVGIGQPSVGASFGSWQVIGSNSVPLVSDPSVIVTPSGVIAMYAIGTDGNLWGTTQTGVGSTFGPWIALTDVGILTGNPVALMTASGLVVAYARGSSSYVFNYGIIGIGQSVRGGSFSGWAPMGMNWPAFSGDPTAVQGTDGTITLYATAGSGSASSVWALNQDYPGNPFGTWHPISATGSFTGRPAAVVLPSGTVVVYAVNGGVLQGAQASVPRGTYSGFVPMGTAQPVVGGSPFVLVGTTGALSLFAIATDGRLWSTAQTAAGNAFNPWVAVT